MHVPTATEYCAFAIHFAHPGQTRLSTPDGRNCRGIIGKDSQSGKEKSSAWRGLGSPQVVRTSGPLRQTLPGEIVRKLVLTEQAFCRWKKEFGGLGVPKL